MQEAKHALILGDGDGRFTASLVGSNQQVRVVAVDSSAVMLRLLSARVGAAGASSRLSTIQGEAVGLLEPHRPSSSADEARSDEKNGRLAAALLPSASFDLVCSHFFLDCLSTSQVERLIDGVRPHLRPGALWVVSEFATPSWWTSLVVALLYRAFGLFAGLKTRQLPRWREALGERSFACVSEQCLLAGLLTSTVWQWDGESSDQR